MGTVKQISKTEKNLFQSNRGDEVPSLDAYKRCKHGLECLEAEEPNLANSYERSI